MARLRKIATLSSLVATLLFGRALKPQAQTAPAVIEPALAAAMTQNGQTSYLIYLKEAANLNGIESIQDRDEQGRAAYDALKQVADRTQASLLTYLSAEMQAGRVTAVKSFFSVNAIGVTSNTETLASVAAFSDAERIILAPVVRIPPSVPGSLMPSINAVEWNIQKVHAPDAWARGIRGQGIVVANIDTGVNYTHPPLVGKYRGSLGGGSFNHNYNWWDPQKSCGNPVTAPCDTHNHGSHTMGTMVGDDGGANKIGVAPGAKWMACKACQDENCDSFALLECADFILAPWNLSKASPDPTKRPHIVNNSWGGGRNDPWFRQAVQAWRPAGIFPAFSAGNSGPDCATAESPGEYPESFATGATDMNDSPAFTSGRGPSSASFGSVVKPNVVAPGVNIRSSAVNGYMLLSGTSMASPHTAGIVALMGSEFESLQRDIPNTQKKLRNATHPFSAPQSLSCGLIPTALPNHVFGSGRVDALRAISVFSVYANQATYVFGNFLTTRLSILNPQASPLVGDFYVGLKTPTSVQSASLGTLTVPGGLEVFDVLLSNSQVANGTPKGDYGWFTIVVPPRANPSNPANYISVDFAPVPHSLKRADRLRRKS